MQDQEVKHWNFPRAFQCICAELSSGPGASWSPSIATGILDNILQLQDITVLCYVPLNTAFMCFTSMCQVQLSRVDISGWIWPCVRPSQGTCYSSDTQENLLFIPENSQLTPAQGFLADVGMLCLCSETCQSQPSSNWEL